MPERRTPQTARAAEAVILIFVVLNVIFVLTGLLPIVLKSERRLASQPGTSESLESCLRRSGAALLACRPPLPGGLGLP